eukprot:15362661-Ditylum_brightwellii.AAC.1
MSSTSVISPFRNDALQNKVAIITGGGSGICYEITKQLLLHGCSVAIICGRRESFLQHASNALSNLTGKVCTFRVCDVRDYDSCAAVVKFAIDRFQRLDIVVNGAAGNFLAEAKTLSSKGFRTVMEIDAIGTYNMCHASYQALTQSKNNDGSGSGGVILNISATLQYGATWYQSHASAAKSAVDSLTRSLALEWGQYNIRVNGIAPGPIADTPGMTKLSPGVDTKDINDMVAEGIPLGKLGKAFDIGMAAVYLCADGSGRNITGDVLVVDGGEWLYRPPMVPQEMVGELSRKVEKKSRDQAPKFVSKL